MKKQMYKIIMMTIVSFALLVASSNAVTLKNVTTNTIVVFDDFENSSTVSSAASPDYSGDYDPDNATVGTWTVSEAYDYVVQVTNYGTPGANSGNNYLRVRRWGASPSPKLIGASQTTIGDLIHFEAVVNVASKTGTGGYMDLYGKNSSDADVTIATVNMADGYITTWSGSYKATGLTYTENVWKKLEIDWVIGADTFTLKYDGQSVTAACRDTSAVSIHGLNLSGYYETRWDSGDGDPGLRKAQFGRATATPAIDGAYDSAWDDAIVYSDFYQVAGAAMAAPITKDIRVRYCGMWDDDNLYVLVEVADNALNRDSAVESWWTDDVVEIYADVLNKRTAYSAGDIYQIACPIELGQTNPVTITPVTASPSGGTYKLAVNANSYVLEASIPWTSLGTGYTPAIGKSIGFGVAVDDADIAGDVRDAQIMWNTKFLDLWQTSASFPRVSLVDVAAPQTTCAEIWTVGIGFGMPQDLNQDCTIDFKDFSDMAMGWLDCVEPGNVNCW